jgi:hypothetical protein
VDAPLVERYVAFFLNAIKVRCKRHAPGLFAFDPNNVEITVSGTAPMEPYRPPTTANQTTLIPGDPNNVEITVSGTAPIGALPAPGYRQPDNADSRWPAAGRSLKMSQLGGLARSPI